MALTPRKPIVRDTGQNRQAVSTDLLLVPGRVRYRDEVTVAAADSLELPIAQYGNLVRITAGSTTISYLNSSQANIGNYGDWFLFKFAGVTKLVNSSFLVLPGGADITTASGDIALFSNEGSATWRCLWYTKADGTPVKASSVTNQLSTENVQATTVGQTSFTIPNGYTPGALLVFLNGVLLGVGDYTATTGTTVVLNSGTMSASDLLGVVRLTATTVSGATMTGATATTAGQAGLVPAPGVGQQVLFLRGDGSWAQVTSSALTIQKIPATAAGQTSFTVPSGYTVGQVLVFLNGVLLDSTEYTATTGTTVVLNSGTKTADDILYVSSLTANLITDTSKLPLAGGQMAGAVNFATPVTLADSATPAIGGANSNNVILNGSTAITGFDTVAAGIVRMVKFTTARVLTYDATKLILPGAANISTAVGDMATFRSLGSGNWECTVYQRADGTPLVSVAGSAPKRAFLTLTTAQSLTTATVTPVSWNTSTDATVWSSSNPTRITVPSGYTKMRLTAQIGFDPNTTGERYVTAGKNGSTSSLYGLPQARFNANSSSGARTDVNVTSAILDVVAGDYFSVSAYQNSGSALTLSTPNLTWLSVEFWP